MSFSREFFEFLGSRRKYWLMPPIIILVLIGLALFFAQGSVIAPFIYTLF